MCRHPDVGSHWLCADCHPADKCALYARLYYLNGKEFILFYLVSQYNRHRRAAASSMSQMQEEERK